VSSAVILGVFILSVSNVKRYVSHYFYAGCRYAEYRICNVLLSRVVLSVVYNELHYVESNKC